MRSLRKWILSIVGCVTFALAITLTFADTLNQPIISTEKLTNKISGWALVHALQQGGYVLYIRHTATNQNQEDHPKVQFAHCNTQRNLSDKGRKQAQTIGQAFKVLHIRVERVITSPYCRCVDTAVGIFGRGHYTLSKKLVYLIGSRPKDRVPRTQYLRQLLGTIPVTGKNIVIVGHTANLKEAAGIWPKQEGVMIVFKPKGNGQFHFVASILPSQWKRLMVVGTKVR
ncbi:MAG: hypothetical protein COB66_04210 [Coxiella sp. (in: Bacteria)]|nr:MAG: hypothetical protein COB66_04210 [Coxiella sp. (in: g-proteobacteria)]